MFGLVAYVRTGALLLDVEGTCREIDPSLTRLENLNTTSCPPAHHPSNISPRAISTTFVRDRFPDGFDDLRTTNDHRLHALTLITNLRIH